MSSVRHFLFDKKILCGLILVVLLSLCRLSVAHAAVDPGSPAPSLWGTIPSTYLNNGINSIQQCDHPSWVNIGSFNFFGTWISPDNNTASYAEVTRAHGSTAPVSLRYNMVAVNCHASGATGGMWIDQVSDNIKSFDVLEPGGSGHASINGITPVVVPGVDGTRFQVNIGNGHLKGARNTLHSNPPFQLNAPAGGWQVSGDYIIRLRFTTTYHRSNNTFACAEGTPAGIAHGEVGDGFCVEWQTDFRVRVNVPPPTPPTVSCSADAGTVYVGNPATFRRSGGTATGTVTWEQGGTPATGSGTSFATRFSSAGTHTVRIRQGGATATCSKTITQPIVVSCARSGSGTVYTDQDVTFTGSSSGASGAYTWSANPAASSQNISGSNSSTYRARWTSAGTKTITVRRSGVSSTCSVTITARRHWNYIHHSPLSTTPASATQGAASYPRVVIGSTITISNRITNDGTGTGMPYTHTIQRLVGGGSWSVITTGNGGNAEARWNNEPALAAGASGSTRSVTYRVPENPGQNLCFRGAISPYRGESVPTLNNSGHPSGSGSGTRYSETRCVTIIYASPAVRCEIESIGFHEDGSTGVPLRIQVSYRNPGVGIANPDGRVTALSLTSSPNDATISGPSPALGANGYSIRHESRDADGETFTYTLTLPSAAIYGFTGRATVTTGSGIAGVNLDPVQSPACTTSAPVGSMPYLKEYGGDVWSGGRFESDSLGNLPAGDTRGAIAAFNRPDDDGFAGAGAQLTVTALLNIKEFASASSRSTANVGSPARTFAPKGLTFSNTAGTTYGGSFGGNRTITDYYRRTRDSSLTSNDPNEPGRRQYQLAADAAISGVIPLGHQKAYFAAGDVYIDGDITLDDYTGGDPSQIPYFALIVCGSIYIDPAVSRLDGLYVAQPGVPITHPDGSPGCAPNGSTPDTSGTIYTCATGVRAVVSAASLHSACDDQLTINGSLVANRIKWLRTFCSLRYAAFGELPDAATGSGNTTCEDSGATRAAEIVNYTPQMWLAPSPLRIPGAPDGGTGSADPYEAIRSLPPIFNTGSEPVGGGGGTPTPPPADDEDEEDEETPGNPGGPDCPPRSRDCDLEPAEPTPIPTPPVIPCKYGCLPGRPQI